MPPPLRILFLAGSARCGSTLVGRMLGELPGMVNAGELGLSLLFADAQAVTAPCGCGQAEADCAFWTAIGDGRALRDCGRPWRTRHLVRLWWRMRRNPRLRAEMAAVFVPLYRRVAQQAGADWVVDISKNPAVGLVLGELPGVELAVLHLVRDPRGVVASWRTRKAYLPKIRPIKVVRWVWFASLWSEFLARRAAVRWCFRYCDVLADPAAMLQAIAARLQRPAPALEFLRPGAVRFGLQHVLFSNPDKLDGGWIPLRVQEVQLDRPARWLTNLLTWPLLARYGYLRPNRSRPAGERTGGDLP